MLVSLPAEQLLRVVERAKSLALECPAHGKAALLSLRCGEGWSSPPDGHILGMCRAAILQRKLLFFTQEKLKAAQLKAATSMLQVHSRVRSFQAGRVLFYLLRSFPWRLSLGIPFPHFSVLHVSLPLLHLQVTKAVPPLHQL